MRSLAIFLVVLLATSIAMTFAFIYEQQIQSVSQTIVKYWSGTYDYRRRITVINTGWLNGWDKRIKITVDHNDVDDILSDFPVLIYLSNSSGKTNEDVSFIFDELQNDANRKKIAVTTSDGVTQCSVEIEKWDTVNEQAWLWTKVPTIGSESDTQLYLYYDADHADNTIYVGDVGSISAGSVWDSNFVAVWHLVESTGGTGEIKDSTSNLNNGTDSGNPTFGAAGQIGNAVRFDGSDDCIVVPDDVSLHLGSGLTIEAWINIDVWGNWEDIVFKGGGAGGNSDYQFALVSTGLAWDGTYGGTWRTKYFPTSQDTGIWIYAAVTHDTVTVKCYRNSSEISSQSDAGAIYESTYQLGISREGAANSGYLDGAIDEIRISNTTRSAAWIKASYESERDHLLSFGLEELVDWLSGWDKRARLTIDQGDIDSILTDFPVLIHLSTSSGRNNDDVSFIFDELQSDANRKKIAVTKSDGVTQCFVEIERWDDVNEQAWLWVKVPNVNSTADTVLYIYYDSTQPDNTAYVGDVGSTPAEKVWDTNFKGVWHLKDLTTSTVEDSTSNNNDGTKGAASQPIEVDAKIGKGQNFTPTTQYIEVGTTGFSASSGTVEVWGKAEGFSGTVPNYLFGHTTQPAWNNRTQLYTDDINGNLDLGLGNSHTRYTNIQDLDSNVWYYVVLTWNGTNYAVYVDSVSKANGTYSGLASIYSLADIGNNGNPFDRGEAWNGTIDEVRVSNMSRNSAWIKATYESEIDDLLDFGSEERKVLSSYSVKVTIDTSSLVFAGKMLSNGDDLRIVYWDGSSWTELDRQIIDMNTTSTQVWFKTQAEISAGGSDDNYFMYYGNSAPPAPLDYWSDSMGADSPSRVFWYADNFEEHANNTDPDGWTNEGSEDYNVVVYEGNRWLKRMVRVNWENGTVASSMSNIGDAVWMVDIRYNQTGSNVWGGLAFHYANGGIGYHFLIRDQGWYWANEDWTVTDGWNTNTDIHFTLGQTGTIKVITVGTTAYCYWINPDGESPPEVFVVAKTIPLGTGKAKIVLESPDIGNTRWIDADNFIIRKYIDPEPLTALGSEEVL